MQMTAPRRDMVDSSSASAYVYAVTWADEASAHADGVAGAPVVSVAHRRIAALVSVVDPSLVRARRRDLLRHSDVVLAASRVGTVVPVGFGTVFASADDVVSELLEPHHDELVSLLQSFEGLAEVTVRAAYREEEVLREIVHDDARVARLREQGAASIELGEAVARALEARRSAAADTILARLRPLAHDIVVEKQTTELEVLRAAFLVDVESLPEFDSQMNELAAAGDTLTFDYVGPLPAYHFAKLPAADGG